MSTRRPVDRNTLVAALDAARAAASAAHIVRGEILARTHKANELIQADQHVMKCIRELKLKTDALTLLDLNQTNHHHQQQHLRIHRGLSARVVV